MNARANWPGWQALPLLGLLLSSGCAHREPAPCPPPVVVRPVLPAVTVRPEGYFQAQLEAILAPYLLPGFGSTPSRPTP